MGVLIELPACCAARHPVTNDPIMIRRGEAGYVPWPAYNPISPEDFNRVHDIDEAIVQTMIACSMSGGWEKADVIGMRRSLERGRERQEREVCRDIDTELSRLRNGEAERKWADAAVASFDRAVGVLKQSASPSDLPPPLSQGTGEWRAVPKELTEKMLSVLDCGGEKRHWPSGKFWQDIWTKLLANAPAPPSQPEGVREALERIIEACESQGFADKTHTGLGAYDACRKARNIARDTLTSLTTTPSRGLVEAAEWQLPETAPKDGTEIIVCCVGKEVTDARFHAGRWQSRKEEYPRWTWLNTEEEYGSILGWIPVPVLRSRTLSAKPTANADDREGDRDA